MSRADDLRAELAVAELEEQLVAAKEAGDAAGLEEVKYSLREARQAFRERRAARPAELSVGDAVARPDTIRAKSTVKEVG